VSSIGCCCHDLMRPIVVSRRCFISILHPSCRRVCGGGRRFFRWPSRGVYHRCYRVHSCQGSYQSAFQRFPSESIPPHHVKVCIHSHPWRSHLLHYLSIIRRSLCNPKKPHGAMECLPTYRPSHSYPFQRLNAPLLLRYPLLRQHDVMPVQF